MHKTNSHNLTKGIETDKIMNANNIRTYIYQVITHCTVVINTKLCLLLYPSYRASQDKVC